MKKILMSVIALLMLFALVVSPASAATMGNDILYNDSVNAKLIYGGKYVSTNKASNYVWLKIPDHGFRESSISPTYSPYMTVKLYRVNSNGTKSLIGTRSYYPDKMSTKTFVFNTSGFRSSTGYLKVQATYRINYSGLHIRTTLSD